MEIKKKTSEAKFPPRYPDFDYSTPGFYFVTICTFHESGYKWRHPFFQPDYKPEEIRRIINKAWERLPLYYNNLAIDERIIMPDHLHFLVHLLDAKKEDRCSLISAVGQFKARITNQWKTWYPQVFDQKAPKYLWQISFYDTIIRSEKHLENTRQYIRNNPLKLLRSQDNEAENRLDMIATGTRQPIIPWS